MSTPRQSGHLRAVAAALLVTFLWSSSWVLIRWGLDDESLSPLSFAAMRYALAAMVLLGWVVSRKPLRASVAALSRTSVLRLVLLGVVFYAITQGASFVAIDNQPAATTSLVLAWTPLLVAVAGGWAIGEAPTGRQVTGAVLVIVGAWAFFAGSVGATIVGMVAAIVALLANAGGALIGRTVNRERDLSPVVVTAVSMAVGALVLLAVGLVAEGVPVVSLRAWLIIGWLAVVNTAFAFTLWNLSLQRLSALESAAINNTMLIQIAVLAWLFLGESLGASELAGIALVSVGILLSQGRER